MKTFTIVLISVFSLLTISAMKVQAQPEFSASVNFNTFYDQLSPYGQWLDLPRYGRVWSYNEPGFRPYYTNGQWQYTDEGWYWNSNYEWGSIPFHYGRWEQDPYYGWIWIPGYDYAPAWVVWSQTDDCYGWAPLGFDLDINVSFGRIPSNRWMYASIGNINRPYIDRYCLPFERNNFYYGRQQPIVNVYTQRNVRYFGGPRWDDRVSRGNRFDQQRPERSEPYVNRGGAANNGSRDYDRQNNDSRPGNIHFDPSTQYDRSRNIAGGRPEMTPDMRRMQPQDRPDMRQSPRPEAQPRVFNQPQMQPDRREMGRQMAPQQRPEIAQGPRPQMTQPRVFSQPQMQPQRNEAPRNMGGGRDRRIF